MSQVVSIDSLQLEDDSNEQHVLGAEPLVTTKELIMEWYLGGAV